MGPEGGSQQMEVVPTPPLVSSSSVCRESYNRWHGCEPGLEIVNYLPNMILCSQLKSHDSAHNSNHIYLFTLLQMMMSRSQRCCVWNILLNLGEINPFDLSYNDWSIHVMICLWKNMNSHLLLARNDRTGSPTSNVKHS